MQKSPADLWRNVKSRYMLMGSVCENCGTKYFPPRIVCKKCGRNTKMRPYAFKGTGEIYSYTVIRTPTEELKDFAPYIIGLVKLDEGPMVEGHIIDNGKPIDIGTRVRAAFRVMHKEGDEGLIYYHYKFEPI